MFNFDRSYFFIRLLTLLQTVAVITDTETTVVNSRIYILHSVELDMLNNNYLKYSNIVRHCMKCLNKKSHPKEHDGKKNGDK